MNLRDLGRSGLAASEVGLGCEHLQDKPLDVVQSVLDAALGGGINILDTFMSQPEVHTNLGIALKGRRDKVLLQGHIGSGWRDGQYFRARVLEDCKLYFQDYMTRLQTDYVDIGMLHFVDTQADYDVVLQNGLIEYAQDLKAKGAIRAVGVSSHDPIIARKLVESDAIDVLMFSLNPAFDILPAETDLDSLFKPTSYQAQETFTITPGRLALYQACVAHGVGITVMKALSGGALLAADTSPYGVAMTVPQCIHYALSRPAVASVLVGCKDAAEVEAALAYEIVDEAARDYAPALSASPKFSMRGKCMYCNHCLPCPSHIDIAQVNKYLDLAEQAGSPPDTVRAHYGALEHTASECIQCAACEERCPFGVPVIERMEAATNVFGA